MPSYKLFSYTGDVKSLIPNGYKFQHLYAANYKSYNKKEIWLFVKGGMVVEIGNLKHDSWYDFIKFIIDNKDKPESFWIRTVTLPMFGDTIMPEFRMIDGVIYSNYELSKKQREDDSFFFKDGYGFDYDTVKQIIELDNLGKLVESTREYFI